MRINATIIKSCNKGNGRFFCWFDMLFSPKAGPADRTALQDVLALWGIEPPGR
jgi:hypothetical protein